MAGTTKKEKRSPAARTVRAQRAGQTSRGNRYAARNVGAGAVVTQGDYNNIQIQQITNVFRDTPPSVEEEAELKKLQEYVLQALAGLNAAIRQKKPAGGNPYHLLEALDISEQDCLAGRSAVIQELGKKLESGRFAVLTGENGIGKTSLLRAGLIPALVKAGHWPLWIEANREPLDTTIKKRVLGSLNDFPTLARRPLKDVLFLTAAFLPPESYIILLVDNAEEFFRQPVDAQQTFADLWRKCVNAASLRVRWLFSAVDVKHYFNRFQSGEKNPFANLIALPPLDRAAAREAILAPAQSAGILVDEALLDVLLDDLGNTEVDPTRMQIVCHTLAGGNASPSTSLGLAAYEKLHRAEGILLAYLDRAIRELAPDDRDPAWQILSLLEGANNRPLTAEWIGKELSIFGYRNLKTDALLETLGRKHLVTFNEEGYRLASESMKLRIREWREQEAVPRKIQKEAARQIQRVRNSALRGLIGGAAGFILFNEIVFINTGPLPDWGWVLFFGTMVASFGGIAGFLLTLSADLARASYHGPRRWLRYAVSGAAGAIAFTIAMVLYANFNFSGDLFLAKLGAALFEGAAWGMTLGLGLMWGLETRRHVWLIALATALACGLVLMGADLVGGALVNEFWEQVPSPLMILLGGASAPLLYLAATLAGQSE